MSHLAIKHYAVQATPWGVLRPPLGMARLTIVGLVGSLLRTGSPEAEQAVADAGLLGCCMRLVLAYPLHSVLHHQVGFSLCPALAKALCVPRQEQAGERLCEAWSPCR